MANKKNDKESPYKVPDSRTVEIGIAPALGYLVMSRWNLNRISKQPALIFNEQDSQILVIVYEWRERNA